MAAQSAHFRLPLLRASDRPHIPYLGPPEDHLRVAFYNAMANVRARIRTTAWAEDLARCETPEQALAFVRETVVSALAALQETAVPIYAQAGMIAAETTGITKVQKAEPAPQIPYLPRRRAVRPLLDSPSAVLPTSQYHIWAAQNMAMDLITRITNQQEAVIRDIVNEAIGQGIDALVTGDRIADVVGLFPRWQRAVENYRANLVDTGARADVVARRTAKYADTLLRKRGLMIARTELMRAMNLGRLTQWREMVDDGRLNGADSVKVWSAAPGACPVCEAMNGVQIRGIDAFFETELGDFDHPPCHPNCRCTMTLIAIPGPRGVSGGEVDTEVDPAEADVADTEE